MIMTGLVYAARRMSPLELMATNLCASLARGLQACMRALPASLLDHQVTACPSLQQLPP